MPDQPPRGAMDTTSHPYRFTIASDRIVVERADRCPVTIRLEPTKFVIVDGDQESAVGLYDYKRLTEKVAVAQLRDWQPRGRGWPGIKTWVIRQTLRGLAPRLSPFWRQLVARANPQVAGVQRKVFAATFGSPPLLLEESLYRREFLVRDLLRYRAAAIALQEIHTLGGRAIEHRLHTSAQVGQLHSLAHQLGARCEVRFQPPEQLSTHAALALLEDWLGLFAPDARSYTSLNRTLMNLPGALPSSLVAKLPCLRLPRPITDRAELALVLWYAGEGDHRHGQVYVHASGPDIRRAMSVVASHLGAPLRPASTRDICDFFRFVHHFPEAHTGGIVGLAEKAIHWHRMVLVDPRTVKIESLLRQKPTARPAIPLPDLPGVRFLETAGDVIVEGARMRHCLASYVGKAAMGGCFLFHVDYGGEQATVEVTPDGRVLQSKGPGNRPNRACQWGRRVLAAWGRQLREHVQSSVPQELPGSSIPF